MSTSTLTSTSTQALAQQTPPNTETCQAIVFTIAGQLLALPLPAVLRVLNSAVLNSNSDNRLVYVDQQPIPLVDLRPSLRRLNDASVKAIASKPQPFLLLAALQSTRPIAIPIDEAPNLMTLPHATMQALPRTYRQQISNLASHVAVIEQQKQQKPLTILLLDLHQLIPASDTYAS